MAKKTTESVSLPISPIKVVLFSLLPALVLLGGMEGCARFLELVRPPLTLDYGWGFNEESSIFAPTGVFRDKMATRPEKLLSFQQQTFDMPKPPGLYRIMIVGGSNAHNMFDNLHRMAARLEQTPSESRHFEVINCGGCGYGSHRLRIMARELLNYEPDLILIYAGHNEFVELFQQSFVDIERIPAQRIAYSFAILRLIRDAISTCQLAWIDPAELRATHPPEVDYAAAGAHTFSADELEERMHLYRSNLAEIIRLFQSEDLPVIISTVATNYWSPDIQHHNADAFEEIQRLYASGRYHEGMLLARDVVKRHRRLQASDIENNIIRELAEKLSIPLVEGEQLIAAVEPNQVPGETFFSDWCHLTEEGREIVVAAFERQIRNVAKVGEQDR